LEFVNTSEVADLLTEHGCEEVTEGEERRYLVLPDQEGTVFLHLAAESSNATPREGATVLKTETEAMPGLVEQIIHRLNLRDVLLIPVGKWRRVFDAVAFSLATNESWQEVDAAATVELNTRDPLLCGPADVQLVIELLRALLSDAEEPEQGLILTATAVPVIVELIPDGAIRLSIGTAALADEIMDVVSVP
jgi:hypothetical protein